MIDEQVCGGLLKKEPWRRDTAMNQKNALPYQVAHLLLLLMAQTKVHELSHLGFQRAGRSGEMRSRAIELNTRLVEDIQTAPENLGYWRGGDKLLYRLPDYIKSCSSPGNITDSANFFMGRHNCCFKCWIVGCFKCVPNLHRTRWQRWRELCDLCSVGMNTNWMHVTFIGMPRIISLSTSGWYLDLSVLRLA